jgi:excisionase family DNA binding protein
MEVLTVEEAAKILKLSPYTVRELLKKQKLPGIKIGGGRQWRIRKADLEAYLHNAGPS